MTPLRRWPIWAAAVALAGGLATGAPAREPDASPPIEDEGCVVVNVGGHTAGALDCVNYALRAMVRNTKRQVAAAQLDATSPPVALGGFNAAATAQAITVRRALRPPPSPVAPVFVQPR